MHKCCNCYPHGSLSKCRYTIKILSIETDRYEQTTQTQIRPQGYKKMFMLISAEQEV